MKKTIRAIAMIAALAAMTCVMFACADNGGQKTDLDSLRNQITALENQLNESKGDITDLENQLNESKGDITALENQLNESKGDITDLENQLNESKGDKTDLENQIKDLEEQLAGKNVFWTEKEEYGEDETMTVYYGKNAVFDISLIENEMYSTLINIGVKIISYITDVHVASILQNTKIEWDFGIALNDTTYNKNSICKKGIALQTWTNFDIPDGTKESATFFNFIVNVPGTPFPLAKFTNLTFAN